MSKKVHKIIYATGSRADYGIVRRYLSLLNSDESVDLSIAVTGSLLDPRYGSQVSLIEVDGFRIAARLPIPLDTSSNVGVSHAMSAALEKFSQFLFDETPDLLIILGDRYEMLSVAIAAAMQAIPILHIHGGEATFGNYDEFIRHSITKMSRFHFTSTEEYRRRVVQLGENPLSVFNLGALGAENCLDVNEARVPEEVLGYAERAYAVVLFHPETLSEADPAEQTDELLSACEAHSELDYVFNGSNADTSSDRVRKRIYEYASSHSGSKYYENLNPDAYHYLVSHSAFLIGNSSSGLIEAPTLGVYSINIGNRQAGRVRGSSVVDAPCRANDIADAIRKVLDAPKPKRHDNPYYQPNCAQRYYHSTMRIVSYLDKHDLQPKQFYDLPS